MERRRFIQAAGLSLFVPAAAGFARGGWPAGEPESADFFFFDDRFEAARVIAAQWPGPAAPTAVRGDVTGVWRSCLADACRRAPLTLCGITTESFHFCLGVLFSDRSRIDSQITRLDRDLHWWTIRSGPDIHITRGDSTT